MRIVILHRPHGCDTGCCGHALEVDSAEVEFEFEHPPTEDFRAWAIKMVERHYPGHGADLDFDSCLIVDD